MQSSESLTLRQLLSNLQFVRLRSLVAQAIGQSAEQTIEQMLALPLPEAIAFFLTQLSPQLTPGERTEYTLKLTGILATLPESGQNALQQQLEQITLQIRLSLELPEILQTAVEQGRQALNVDRLLIYQLQATPEAPNRGFIAHEAKVESVPSVLNLMDACDWGKRSRFPAMHCQGLALALDDIQVAYSNTPCLRKFLAAAQVRSKMIAPIFLKQELWGFVLAHECRLRQWQEDEQRFLQQMAEHLAIAISQAGLYAEVQRQKENLERRVIERTQELQEVTQAAQSANRAKSEFLASVTHELRTPLTCIIGMSTTLQRWSKDTLNERQQSFLQTIHDSGEQLLTLINDILDVSQAEANQVQLNLSEFSLSMLVRQVLKSFAGQAAMGEVELELNLDGDRDAVITADSRRLQQVLFNLLDNAIKFTPKGGKVSLRTFQNNQQVTFQIRDTGIGIAADQIPLLFQKFRQLDAGYQRQFSGTGLGLALTKQLVELHGGWIDVESTLGVGSAFTVRLPATQSNVTVRVPPVVEKPRGRIVLIDHDEDNASMICDVLTAAGYQIVWMLEGSTALDQIEALHPFAVIVNTQSDIDGESFLRGLRRNLATKALKAIVMVHESEARSEAEWHRAGADATLVYPIRPDLLLQKILLL
jgi:two-component system, sensor histidine kinase and response regulator